MAIDKLLHHYPYDEKMVGDLQVLQSQESAARQRWAAPSAGNLGRHQPAAVQWWNRFYAAERSGVGLFSVIISGRFDRNKLALINGRLMRSPFSAGPLVPLPRYIRDCLRREQPQYNRLSLEKRWQS